MTIIVYNKITKDKQTFPCIDEINFYDNGFFLSKNGQNLYFDNNYDVEFD